MPASEKKKFKDRFEQYRAANKTVRIAPRKRCVGPSLEELILTLPLELRLIIYELVMDENKTERGCESVLVPRFYEDLGSNTFLDRLLSSQKVLLMRNDSDGTTSQIALEARMVCCKSIVFIFQLWKTEYFATVCKMNALYHSVRRLRLSAALGGKRISLSDFKGIGAAFRFPSLKSIYLGLHVHGEMRSKNSKYYTELAEDQLPEGLRLFKVALSGAVKVCKPSREVMQNSIVYLYHYEYLTKTSDRSLQVLRLEFLELPDPLLILH
ncbi:MAG: hypothetical protein M1831_000364 [Alyxoria varia]|nr:MAG: hypothetical protein M1831_000364 [Alyxoria varia]